MTGNDLAPAAEMHYSFSRNALCDIGRRLYAVHTHSLQ